MHDKYTEVKYKWDNTLHDQFRSGIIANLHVFNSIIHNIDCTSVTAIIKVLQVIQKPSTG
jgi:hypothetical protein